MGKGSRWRKPICLLFAVGFLSAPSWARGEKGEEEQAPAKSNAESKSLAQRVKALEDQLASYQSAADEKFRQAHAEQLRLHFNLYGDAEYRVAGPAASFPRQNGFYLGQTDLHIMAQYGPHLSAMSEDVVEFDGQSPSIDLERIVVFYTFSDAFRVGAGRDHTSFGYWNRTFHHGDQFQTTIDRPFFLAFEDGGGSDQAFKKGGVVPAHIVGLFGYGTFNLGGAALKYELNVGNNGSIGLNTDGAGNPTDAAINFNPTGDGFNSKRLAARLVFKPDADGGLALGVASVLSHYSVAASDPLLPPGYLFNDLAQLLLEGEVVYTDDKLELLSEFYEFDDNTGLGGASGSAANRAYYVQLAYQATPDLKPYLRVENLDVDGTDPFFRSMLWSNRTVYLAGVRYDLVPVASSLKLELHLIDQAGANATEVATAWGFGF